MAIYYYCLHLLSFHVDMEDRIYNNLIYDIPHACLHFLRVRHSCAVSLNTQYDSWRVIQEIIIFESKVQTLPIWRGSRVPEGPARVELCTSLNWWSPRCYLRASSSNPNSSTPEPNRPQYDRPPPPRCRPAELFRHFFCCCTIITAKKNSARFSKLSLFQFLKCLKLGRSWCVGICLNP